MVMAVVMLFWFDESDFDFIVVKCGSFGVGLSLTIVGTVLFE
jgi:hypothetical protein